MSSDNLLKPYVCLASIRAGMPLSMSTRAKVRVYASARSADCDGRMHGISTPPRYPQLPFPVRTSHCGKLRRPSSTTMLADPHSPSSITPKSFKIIGVGNVAACAIRACSSASSNNRDQLASLSASGKITGGVAGVTMPGELRSGIAVDKLGSSSGLNIQPVRTTPCLPVLEVTFTKLLKRAP